MFSAITNFRLGDRLFYHDDVKQATCAEDLSLMRVYCVDNGLSYEGFLVEGVSTTIYSDGNVIAEYTLRDDLHDSDVLHFDHLLRIPEDRCFKTLEEAVEHLEYQIMSWKEKHKVTDEEPPPDVKHLLVIGLLTLS